MSALFLLLFIGAIFAAEMYLLVRCIQSLDDLRFLRKCFQLWFQGVPYQQTPIGLFLAILGSLLVLVMIGAVVDALVLGASTSHVASLLGK